MAFAEKLIEKDSVRQALLLPIMPSKLFEAALVCEEGDFLESGEVS